MYVQENMLDFMIVKNKFDIKIPFSSPLTLQCLTNKILNFRWNKRSRAFVVDNLFSIECAELEDLVAVLEVGS